PGLEVARLVELAMQPGTAEGFRVGSEFVLGAPRGKRFECRLRRHHPRLDGAVAALDAGGVEKARLVADQAATREHELRQRLQAAGGNGARAVGNALAAFEKAADRGMGLVALELFVRVE